MPSDADDFLPLLDSALAEPLGVKIPTPNGKALRQKLYSIMREHAPKYEGLELTFSPFDTNEVWVVKSAARSRKRE